MSNNNWEEINAKGINGQNAIFSNIFFLNSDIGFLLGSHISNENLINKNLSEFNAILLTTSDGGKKWSQQDFGKGRFQTYTLKNDKIFISKTITKQNTEELSSDTSIIYYSSNAGKTWSELFTLNGFFIRDLFVSANDIIILGKNESQSFWSIKKSSDNGLTWVTIGNLPNDLSSPILINNKLFYITEKIHDAIISVDLIKLKMELIKMPSNQFRPYNIVANNEDSSDIYITGKMKGRVNIYKYSSKTLSFDPSINIDVENIFPVSLHLFQNKLILLAGKRNNIGVTYFVYYKSKDDLDWHQESVPSSYFEPYTFFQNTLCGYSYGDIIYKGTF